MARTFVMVLHQRFKMLGLHASGAASSECWPSLFERCGRAVAGVAGGEAERQGHPEAAAAAL